MKVSIKNYGSFDNIMKQLEKMSSSNPKKSLEKIGDMSCEVLSRNSPVRTGELSRSWKHEVIRSLKGYELSIYNDAHDSEVDNLPMLLEYGHGTGTGGWVSGTHFVSNSMNEVNEIINDEIEGMIVDE